MSATATKEDYQAILLEPEHFDLGKKGIAKLMGVNIRTLYRWDKDLDWRWILDERRKLYASRIAIVDDAVFKQAAKGDRGSAELYYKRFDGWVDETKVINEKALNDDELRDMAREIGEELGKQERTPAKKKRNPPRTRKKKKG